MTTRRWHSLPAVALAMALLAPAQVVAADPAETLPERDTILEPGRYASSFVGPTVDFRVEEGWIVGLSGGGPIFTLEYMDAPGTVLSVTRFDGQAFLDSCDPSSMTDVEATVPRLAEIIAGNPFLNASGLEPIEVDGHAGLSIDVGVPAFAPTECSLPYLLVWAVPMEGGEFLQYADQQSRFLLLDVDGDVIVIAIESIPGVPFASFLEAAMELVGTMDIEPGEYIPPEPTPEPTSGPESAATHEAADESGPYPAPPADESTAATSSKAHLGPVPSSTALSA